MNKQTLNKEKNFMSAVIYVHNAEKRVETFLRTVMKVMEEHFEHSEIICVNDDSSDNSVEVIKRVSKDAVHTSVSVLNMSYYHGLEVAMNAGIAKHEEKAKLAASDKTEGGDTSCC